MAIIVEDGTGVAGANSYASAAAVTAYALDRGIALPASIDAMIFRAMDYLESFSARFVGVKSDRDQSLSWPRDYVVIDGFDYPSTLLPPALINALSELVIEVNAGSDPFNPPIGSMPVIRERVEGAVEVEYSDPVGQLAIAVTRPSMRLINHLISAGQLFAVRA